MNGLPPVPLLTFGSVVAPNPPELPPKGDRLLGLPNPPKDLLADPNTPPLVALLLPKAEVVLVLALLPKALLVPKLLLLFPPKGDELLPKTEPPVALLVVEPKAPVDAVLLLPPKAEPDPNPDPNPLVVLLLLLPNKPPDCAELPPKGEELAAPGAVLAPPNGDPEVARLEPNPPNPELELPNIKLIVLMRFFLVMNADVVKKIQCRQMSCKSRQ